MSQDDERVIVPEQVARELVDAQFPEWAALPLAPVDLPGFDNVTMRLGDSFALKFPSARRYVEHARIERQSVAAIAGNVPVPVPEEVAVGAPGAGYPYAWQVLTWIPGKPASLALTGGSKRLGTQLGEFLRALWGVDCSAGAAAGDHNFHRGGRLDTYSDQTADAIAALDGVVDELAARTVWDRAVATQYEAPPVWVHGDFAPGNILVADDGDLAGVIDFGTCAVGDPACDLAIAWTFFEGDARAAFRDAVGLDADTWARARGWALWKALILTWWKGGSDPYSVANAPRVLAEVLADPIVE